VNTLTQITVNKTVAAHKCLSDAYAWHKALWEAFPDRPDDNRDFLFRTDDQRSEFRVLLLSPYKPTPQTWGQWESKPISEDFLTHSHYAFQLKVNPTKRRCEDRRRLGIYNVTELKDWMTRKAQQFGFSLIEESLSIGSPMDETFLKNHHRGKHVSVDFTGHLTVTDPIAFKTGFEQGIGSAKAFGFGLLMLQPLR
jgi:CRISPR system Cascade subunit CasE